MFTRIIILLISIYLGFNSPLCQAAENPNLLGNKGLQLIQAGKEAEGLDLIKQAIQADPQIPDWHMNYGSMLFLKGQKIFQSGNTQEATEIFKESEKELVSAIQLFKETDGKLKSHCYFLLGDIYQYAYGEKDKAKEYYEKSLSIYPQHGGAKAALKDLGAIKIPMDAQYKNKIVYTTDSAVDTTPLKEDCYKRKGVYKECGSPCENKNEPCIAVCAFTCELTN